METDERASCSDEQPLDHLGIRLRLEGKQESAKVSPTGDFRQSTETRDYSVWRETVSVLIPGFLPTNLSRWSATFPAALHSRFLSGSFLARVLLTQHQLERGRGKRIFRIFVHESDELLDENHRRDAVGDADLEPFDVVRHR
jgi:hypothetical protein